MLLKIIFDTAAFLAGLEKYFYMVYTVPSVIDEVKDSHSREILDLGIAAQRIIIMKPSLQSISVVKGVLNKLNERTLSHTDIEVASLAVDLGSDSVVYTDDLSLQNVLKHLGIRYESVKLRGKLNVKIEKYIYECQNCHTTYSHYVPYCTKCGGRVTKKILKR